MMKAMKRKVVRDEGEEEMQLRRDFCDKRKKDSAK
jgi:hypothetical protein